MPNLSASLPVTIPMTDTLLNLVQGLKPDQVYRGVVSETPKGNVVNVNGARIALPQNSTLAPGQPVTVTLQVESGVSKIIIEASSSSATPTAKTIDPMTLIKTVMQQLPGLASLAPEQAAALVPSVLPSSDALVRLALQILQVQARAPEAVTIIVRTLQQHTAKGSADASVTTVLELLGSNVKLDEPKSILQFLKRVQSHTQRPPLAGFSESFTNAQMSSVRGDTHLYQLLAAIRGNQSLAELLEGTGGLKLFREATETLMDHTAGQHLQNARSLEIPYAYMNLPLGEEAISQVQIHILGEGRNPEDWGEGAAGQIVLDLETSRLGPMWIHIEHTADTCSCRFDVASDEVAEHINNAADTLAARLEGASFKNVSVRAATWDGDRLASIAKLFQRVSGLDIKA
jgi:hypothetical protein